MQRMIDGILNLRSVSRTLWMMDKSFLKADIQIGPENYFNVSVLFLF